MEGVVFHFFPYNVGNASSLPFRLQFSPLSFPLWVACQLLHVIKSNIKHTEILLLHRVPCGPGPALSSRASECSASKRRREDWGRLTSLPCLWFAPIFVDVCEKGFVGESWLWPRGSSDCLVVQMSAPWRVEQCTSLFGGQRETY